jgi:hypothetical protein
VRLPCSRTTGTDERAHDIAGRPRTTEGLVAGERVSHRCSPATEQPVPQCQYDPNPGPGKDSVEFVRLVWEAIERSLREEDQ